jgi:hypothetical protein
MLHTRGLLQSVLRMHVAPGCIFFAEPQPTASHDETIIKPRTRDADISILQIGFRSRESQAARSYHNC